MGRKSTLTASQKESIRYYSGQGEGPSGIAYYTGIPPVKIGYYLRSLGRDGRGRDVPETTAAKGQREGQLPRGRGTKLTDNEAATMDRGIASGEYSCPAAVARDFHVSYQTARMHWNRVKAQPEGATPAIEAPEKDAPQPAPMPTQASSSYLFTPEQERGAPAGRQSGLDSAKAAQMDHLWRGGVRTTRGLAEATGLSRRAVQDYMERRGWESEWRREEKPRDNGPAQLPMFLGDLAGAIRKSTRGRMEEEAADQIAQHVLNFFGYSDRIIDNILEPEDRDLFYNLEDSGILTTEREETSLYDGKEWRIHYWMFRRDKIADIVAHAREAEKAREAEGADAVYGRVPEEVWRSHRIEPVEGIHVSPELAAANAGAKGTGTLPA